MPDLRDTARTVPTLDMLRQLEPEEFSKLGKKASKLVGEGGDKFVNNVAGVLVATLQQYQLARAALSRRCIELKISEEVEGFVIESMRNQAGTDELTRKGVLNKSKNLVLPFLMAEYQAEQVREHESVDKSSIAEDGARREQGIPLPYKSGKWWEQKDEYGTYLTRERPMVVTGDPGAIQVFLDDVQRKAVTSRPGGFRPNVLRLVEEGREHNKLYRKGEEVQHFELGINRWLNCGLNPRSLLKELTPWVRLLRKKRVDLMIIENLAMFTGGMEHLPQQHRAGLGLRHLGRWMETQGCAVVAAIPLERKKDQPVNEFEFPELDNTWSNLEVYSHLLQVGVEEADESSYKLFAQRHGDPEQRSTLAYVARDLIDNWRKRDNTDT